MDGMKYVELVVKMPEESYNAINKHGTIEREQYEDVIMSIQGATVLQRGHDRLVETRAVIKALFDKKTIDDVPTIVEADREDWI